MAGTTNDAAFVEFQRVQKSYDGENLVVKDLNLSMPRGEFLTMLGPSGSGKTTCLMMLAGFETATHGEILPGWQTHQQHPAAQARDRDGVPELCAVSAYDGRREPLVSAGSAQIGQVGTGREGQARAGHGSDGPVRWSASCTIVGRSAARIALARALVFEPELVLMDEPLGALDKQLREHMQFEITRLAHELGSPRST